MVRKIITAPARPVCKIHGVRVRSFSDDLKSFSGCGTSYDFGLAGGGFNPAEDLPDTVARMEFGCGCVVPLNDRQARLVLDSFEYQHGLIDRRLGIGSHA